MMEEGIIEKFKVASKKLLLLDYDGTLVNFASKPENAIADKKLLETLSAIVNLPELRLIIITGRAHQDIDKLLGQLPVDIIAEHGAMFKINGRWSRLIADNVLWKEALLPLLNSITLLCPHSFVEEKQFSLTWHYRNANAEEGYSFSRALIQLLENITVPYNLKILDGNKVVEILSKEVGKGAAVKLVIEQDNYDFILAIGDDTTDEEMFGELAGNVNAATIKVGMGDTLAKYKIKNVEEAVSFLVQLINYK